jgi:hypothetical protein
VLGTTYYWLRYPHMDGDPYLDLSLIFPIKDEPSACLMVVKADCLYRAGVITDAQRQQVHARADDMHGRSLAA